MLTHPVESTSPSTVSVLVDVPAIERVFDYRVPPAHASRVTIGTMVRVPLAGRRVDGWVVALDPPAPVGVELAELTQVSGVGPDADVIDLCRWVAWRWAGRVATVLRSASPDRRVSAVGAVRHRPPQRGEADALAIRALDRGAGVHVIQVAPDADPLAVAHAAAERGQVIVIAPAVSTVDRIGRGLRAAGAGAARWPRDFAAAAAGDAVIGGRPAVLAPAPALAAIIVWDEHDERLQHEGAPTWHAREVAVERARRAGVPCLLVSPAPSLEARRSATSPLIAAERPALRSGWVNLEIIDRRDEDRGRSGLFSPALVTAIRDTVADGGRVLCLLNRTGRARLLVCRSCDAVVECDQCGSTMLLGDDAELVCARCPARRPQICASCGGTALANLRPGVSRAREQLEALVRVPVVAVTGGERTRVGGDPAVDDAPVVIGTEAVLHRVASAGLVALLDVDQELLAPRYRATDEALALLVQGSRVASGGPSVGAVRGRLMVQTRIPDHPVLQAVLHADPGRLVDDEWNRRVMLGDPPAATLAVVGGEAAPAFVERLGRPSGVEVMGPDDSGRWLFRSDDQRVLLDALSAVERPPGRLRLWVDPARTG